VSSSQCEFLLFIKPGPCRSGLSFSYTLIILRQHKRIQLLDINLNATPQAFAKVQELIQVFYPAGANPVINVPLSGGQFFQNSLTAMIALSYTVPLV
jgi:hypothetical protein